MKLWHFTVLVILAAMFTACGAAKANPLSGLFKVQAAEQIKAADTIKGADTIKVADKLADGVTGTAEAQVGVGNSSNKTSVGGNQTISNDTALMKEYINLYKEMTERYIRLMRYIVWGLLVEIFKLTAIIGAVLVSLLKSNEQDDTFKEKLLSKGGNNA